MEEASYFCSRAPISEIFHIFNRISIIFLKINKISYKRKMNISQSFSSILQKSMIAKKKFNPEYQL